LAPEAVQAVEKMLVSHFTVRKGQLVAEELEDIENLFLILVQADWQFHVHLVLMPLL
jgi:hypothetical protein